MLVDDILLSLVSGYVHAKKMTKYFLEWEQLNFWDVFIVIVILLEQWPQCTIQDFTNIEHQMIVYDSIVDICSSVEIVPFL